jgi:two-component sensor histidine kinase
MNGRAIDGGELARLRREVVEVSAENAALRSRLAQAADAERRLTLAVRELGHRLKNTLATVQAIVNLTARSAQTIDDFRVAVTKRIAALAKNHALLLANDWTGASLEQVLRAELAPFDDGTGQRIQLEGPDVHLPPDAALALAMAAHELTTNAAKHGALSVPVGRVEVTWSVSGQGGGRRLMLDWIERNGPPIRAPANKGFGSTLIERVLGSQLKGSIKVDFAPEGLRLRLEAPLSGEAPRASAPRRKPRPGSSLRTDKVN